MAIDAASRTLPPRSASSCMDLEQCHLRHGFESHLCVTKKNDTELNFVIFRYSYKTSVRFECANWIDPSLQKLKVQYGLLSITTHNG